MIMLSVGQIFGSGLEQFHLRVALEVEIAVECLFWGTVIKRLWTRAEDPLLRWFNHEAGKLVVGAGGRPWFLLTRVSSKDPLNLPMLASE